MRMVLMFGLLASCCVAGEWRAAMEEEQLTVFHADTLVTTYKFGDEQKYPYFYPVNGPLSGESVTTESSEPYPHHHSLFFGCDKVNRGNYWQDHNARGQILSQGPKIVEQGERVVFTDETLWQRGDREPIIREERRVTVASAGLAAYTIDFETTLHPLTEVTIEKTNHALFSARMVPELSVKGGGTLVNAAGEMGEEETFGKKQPWMDYYGTRRGSTEGLAIFDHPSNPWHPSPWFTRDYGFFSPTPMQWLDAPMVLAEGAPLTLRWRVLVHAGDTEAAQVGEAYDAYAELAE